MPRWLGFKDHSSEKNTVIKIPTTVSCGYFGFRRRLNNGGSSWKWIQLLCIKNFETIVTLQNILTGKNAVGVKYC